MNGMGGLERVRSGDLLYTDEVGHDACGIGGVAARDGKPSRRSAAEGRPRPEEHGAPRRRLRRRRRRRGHHHHHPASLLQGGGQAAQARRRRATSSPKTPSPSACCSSSTPDPAKAEQARALLRETLAGGPVQFLGFRPVPTNEDALPAAPATPGPAAIEQVLLQRQRRRRPRPSAGCILRRLELRERFSAAGLNGLHSVAVGAARQLQGAADQPATGGLLRGPARTRRSRPASPPSTAATARTRSRTGRSPSRSGSPATTARSTPSAPTATRCHAFARGLNPPLPGGDLLTPKMSDSASLDEWIEYLDAASRTGACSARCGSRSRRCGTPRPTSGARKRSTCSPTTAGRSAASPRGTARPASSAPTAACSSGWWIAWACGPVRWCSDKRGWLYIGSESGVFGLDTTTIVASGQLQPGQMIALDTATGERLDSYQIMARVVAECEGGTRRRPRTEPPADHHSRRLRLHPADRRHRRRDARRAELDARPSAAGGRAGTSTGPCSSRTWRSSRRSRCRAMGHDRVLTVFSQHHPTLFKYLQQTFAEVTNPPIDPYREGGAMSLATYLGRGPPRRAQRR